jgi:hypothetical protein
LEALATESRLASGALSGLDNQVFTDPTQQHLVYFVLLLYPLQLDSLSDGSFKERGRIFLRLASLRLVLAPLEGRHIGDLPLEGRGVGWFSCLDLFDSVFVIRFAERTVGLDRIYHLFI